MVDWVTNIFSAARETFISRISTSKATSRFKSN